MSSPSLSRQIHEQYSSPPSPHTHEHSAHILQSQLLSSQVVHFCQTSSFLWQTQVIVKTFPLSVKTPIVQLPEMLQNSNSNNFLISPKHWPCVCVCDLSSCMCLHSDLNISRSEDESMFLETWNVLPEGHSASGKLLQGMQPRDTHRVYQPWFNRESQKDMLES